MPEPTAPNPLRSRLEELKTLKDEIRVGLHLAGMDLRDEWNTLERRLPDASALATDLKQAGAEVIDSLATELRDFRDRLRSSNNRP